MVLTLREELAYLAGVMDADGCFALSKYRTGIRGQFGLEVLVVIIQEQPEALHMLAARFGGTVRYESKPRGPLAKRRLYQWKRTGEAAVCVCVTLHPFLLLKRRQAEILIAAQDEINDLFGNRVLGPPRASRYPDGRLVRRYQISDESLARRQAWLREMRSLNASKYRVSDQVVSK